METPEPKTSEKKEAPCGTCPPPTSDRPPAQKFSRRRFSALTFGAGVLAALTTFLPASIRGTRKASACIVCDPCGTGWYWGTSQWCECLYSGCDATFFRCCEVYIEYCVNQCSGELFTYRSHCNCYPCNDWQCTGWCYQECRLPNCPGDGCNQ